ncbi:MAG: branched-chain amino acid ABC transporter permease [Lachnospiraceae bacterium]|nr:branched-chain amino acid ABC transporter permease [Lachnospiraceae bacterium]
MTGKNRWFIMIGIMIAGYAICALLAEGNLLNRQMKSLIVPAGINIILAVSLNITTGFLGELSLGHAGFMAIGAYTGAIFTKYITFLPPVVAFFIGILLGGIMAALFGILIGMPVLRLRGDYLAIVTLAFGEIIRSVINAMHITGGAKGLAKIPTYTNYTWVYVIMITTVLVARRLLHSRQGRAIVSIRENTIAAEAVGVQVTRYKILAFAIAAFFAGMAGVLYAHNFSILKPDNFDYNKSIDILVFVVLGGMGSVKGSTIAAVILTVLPEVLRSADDLRKLLYALALIIIMIYKQGNKRGWLGRLFKKKEAV